MNNIESKGTYSMKNDIDRALESKTFWWEKCRRYYVENNYCVLIDDLREKKRGLYGTKLLYVTMKEIEYKGIREGIKESYELSSSID